MAGAAAVNKFPASASVALGSPASVSLPNASSIQVPALTLTTTLETNTAGAEDSSLTFSLLAAGAQTNWIKFSAKSGQYPLEVVQQLSTPAIGFTAGFDSEIVRTGTKNTGYGTTGVGAAYMYSNNAFGMVVQGNGTVTDVCLASNVALTNGATNGFAHMPQCETTGVMTGTPSFQSGFFSHHAAFCFNKADNTINVWNGTAWKRTVALT